MLPFTPSSITTGTQGFPYLEKSYEKFEQGSEGLEKLHLSGVHLEDYVFNVIAKTLGLVKSASLTKDVDLFAFGVDSLQGTRIRNAMQKELELSGQTLGQNSKTFPKMFPSYQTELAFVISRL